MELAKIERHRKGNCYAFSNFRRRDNGVVRLGNHRAGSRPGTRGGGPPTTVPFAPPALLGGTTVDLVAADAQFVSNAIPFGNNTLFGFTGFMYRNVPAFTLEAGRKFAFDLGATSGEDIRRDIYFSVANINPGPWTGVSQGVKATTWVQVASTAQIPTSRGNGVCGDFELEYTAETTFNFSGGGLLVGFAGSPPAAFPDSSFDQVLCTTTASDSSDLFYGRFFFHSHLGSGVLDLGSFSDSFELGGIQIQNITCGDGTCELDEDSCNCPEDCGAGRIDDGICCAADGEDSCNSQDCGVPVDCDEADPASGAVCDEGAGLCASVPTVSEWGLSIMVLLGLATGTILYGRRRLVRS